MGWFMSFLMGEVGEGSFRYVGVFRVVVFFSV